MADEQVQQATPPPMPSTPQNRFEGRGHATRGGRGGGGGFGQRGGKGRDRGGKKEPSEYEEEVIQIDRVTRVVKGGRRLRFRATVVIGNKKGKVAIGIGKSVEVAVAIQKAIAQAKKHFIVVPIMNGTIPHSIAFKFKRSQLILLPARPGAGLKAGGSVRKILELAGVKNVLSKMIGCRNKLTNAQAAIMMLQQLKPFTNVSTHSQKQ